MQVEHVLDASYGDASIAEAQTLSIEVLASDHSISTLSHSLCSCK
jgi:hypothetical protein